jgi:DNA replication protein DnaC
MVGPATTNLKSSQKLQSSNNDSEERLKKFADFVKFDTCGDPELHKLLQSASLFWGAVRRHETPRWLVLIGDTGVGKTHLAKRLASCAGLLCRRHNQGDETLGPRQNGKTYESHVFSWPKVVSGFFRGDYDILEDMRDEWFVVIDDIGSTRAKMDDLVVDQLFQVLDGRHNKWTVITTNKSLSELARLDVRIQDRLSRGKSEVVFCETISFSMR